MVDDLSWYASRLGPERSDKMPRGNKWSFEQNLWKLLREAKQWEVKANSIDGAVDSGKECVGAAAEIMLLFPYPY